MSSITWPFPNDDSTSALTSSQFEYRKQIEEEYSQRIQSLVGSIVGPERVRASVAAELDFTQTEQTRESFDPALAVGPNKGDRPPHELGKLLQAWPVIEAKEFDLIWFAVILTINMEVGLITPPVGLNLYVLKGVAPDVPLMTVLKGSLPFVLLMFLAMVILSVFPEIALWLPNQMLGAG